MSQRRRWRGWRWWWWWCRMRLVPLCVMTGLGFSLGLLCSLLLQLPAHNLPANDDLPAKSVSHHDDPGFRSRRSFSAVSSVETPNWPGIKVPRHRSVQPGPGGSQAGGAAFQSVSDPQIVSNPVVAGQGAGHHTVAGHQPSARLSARTASQAERRESGVNRQEGEKNGGQGSANTASLSPSADVNRPVKSFTLRLKNTGEKFVVDSAVKRPVEGGAAKETPPQTRPPSDDDTNHTWLRNLTLSDMVTGAVWSRRLEDACPKGFEAQEASWWRRKVAGMQVVRVEEGCGRMQNRRVTFTDGSQACARYRFNTDQLQGELYSYHLARLLNITRLPPALLLPVHSLSPQWRGVHLALSTAQWTDGRPVILTRWLPHLTPAYIPPPLRQDDRRLHPTWDTLGGRTLPELCDLLQWSDLIVFDYLTANLDRLVNNMFNRQWNTEMMNNPAHNLERTEAGSLVFLDNESGLFHGYRLLDKYQGYHQALLASLCVFRDSTARAVKTLHASGTVGQQLQQLVRAGEPHHALLPALPDKNLHVLTDRLAAVHRHILTCEALYPR